jgi:hypothetical protein
VGDELRHASTRLAAQRNHAGLNSFGVAIWNFRPGQNDILKVLRGIGAMLPLGCVFLFAHAVFHPRGLYDVYPLLHAFVVLRKVDVGGHDMGDVVDSIDGLVGFAERYILRAIVGELGN